MNNFAKILFEQIGTTKIKSERSEDFIKFFKTYISAREKMDRMELIKSSLINNPNIKSFSVEVDYNEPQPTLHVMGMSLHEPGKDNMVMLLLTYLMRSMPTLSMAEKLAEQDISLSSIDKIEVLTEMEKKVFLSVENFEIEALESAALLSDKKKVNKI